MSEGSIRVGARFWVFPPISPKGRVVPDPSHGSAYPCQVALAHRGCSVTSPAPNHSHSPPFDRGCSSRSPRRGVARTGPRAHVVVAAGCGDLGGRLPPPAIQLDPGDDAYRGLPCWAGRAARWAHWTVPIAYDLRYDRIRPLMCNGGVSRQALVAVAAARARYADHATGRNSRPTNERLAQDTGYTVRTVQRVDEALRLLGVGTEVLRGRQRTRAERLASWRVGDRGRGWASVWALHDNQQLSRLIHSLSSHPRSGVFTSKRSLLTSLTTHRRHCGRRQRGATRRHSPDEGGLALAKAWRAHPGAPPWCRRHSSAAWSRILARPARHGWTPRDLNQMVTDWLSTGHWIPDSPHKPIGLLGAILARHGRDNLDERPAALDDARDAQELALRQAREEPSIAELDESRQAKLVGRQALSGPGRAAVRQALDDAARRRNHV